MPLATTSIFKIFPRSLLTVLLFASVIASLSACTDVMIKDSPIKTPVNDSFNDSFEKVWRAVQLAMRKYPVKTNIYESGILETDYVKSDKLFSDPNDAKSPAGLRYRLIIRAVKGRIGKSNVVKVSVTKVPEVQSDFFSGYRPIDSDGLEENAVLYRIGRFLEIK